MKYLKLSILVVALATMSCSSAKTTADAAPAAKQETQPAKKQLERPKKAEVNSKNGLPSAYE